MILQTEQRLQSVLEQFNEESHSPNLLVPLKIYLHEALLLNRSRSAHEFSKLTELLEALLEIEGTLSQYANQNLSIANELLNQRDPCQNEAHAAMMSFAANKQLLANMEIRVVDKIALLLQLSRKVLAKDVVEQFGRDFHVNMNQSGLFNDDADVAIDVSAEELNGGATNVKRRGKRISDLLNSSASTTSCDDDLDHSFDGSQQKLTTPLTGVDAGADIGPTTATTTTTTTAAITSSPKFVGTDAFGLGTPPAHNNDNIFAVEDVEAPNALSQQIQIPADAQLEAQVNSNHSLDPHTLQDNDDHGDDGNSPLKRARLSQNNSAEA